MQQPPFTALAQVYNAIMSDVEYDAWADFVLTYARDSHFEPRTALDLACGTGGFSAELQRAGLQVTGLDGSAEMLAIAAQQLNDVPLIQGDLRHWELPADLPQHYDLITCVFDSLNNLTGDGELLLALRLMQRHLAPNGLLAFDVNTRLGVRELWEGNVLEGLAPMPDGREVHYQWSHSYDESAKLGVVQAFCRVLDDHGQQEEFVEVHHERGYDPPELHVALREAGFAGWEIIEYPDYADPESDSVRVWVFAWLQKADG